jgi:6-phosphogluconolactonase/glucosamine-6-phosphate isomerase/deaminase
MKEFVVPSLAIPVGSIWRDMQEHITTKRNFFVAAPLSSTPLPVYHWIVEHSNTFSGWEKVKFVLMDEMVQGERPPFRYINKEDAASYEGFANRNFFEALHDRIASSVEIVKPDLVRLDEFSTPLDLLILALGVKGNYANVMPGTQEHVGWHVAHLLSEFKQAHTEKGSTSYAGATFTEYGMSLGPQQVLSAGKVVVIISGEKKKELTKELKSYSSFNPAFPLSIIYHPNISDRVEMYITEDVV